jgi:predicted nucleic acid-binding protein
VSEHSFLVDSSVWIRFLRKGTPPNIRVRIDDLLKRGMVSTNGLLKVEILGGAHSEQEFEEYSARFDALHQLTIDDNTWHAAARLGYELRRRGLTCLTADLIIAASAIAHEAVLVHADADFDRIAANSELRVESFAEAG